MRVLFNEMGLYNIALLASIGVNINSHPPEVLLQCQVVNLGKHWNWKDLVAFNITLTIVLIVMSDCLKYGWQGPFSKVKTSN